MTTRALLCALLLLAPAAAAANTSSPSPAPFPGNGSAPAPQPACLADPNITDADTCCECFHDTCALATANCELGTGGTNLFNYYNMQYCAFESAPWLSYLILGFWVLVVFSLLGTTADNFFVTQLETLSAQLKLSPSTAAITLLALGNSAPDVFSDLAAVQGNSDFSLAIGELMGASMFLTTVVLAAVILYATAVIPTEDGGDGQARMQCKVDKTPIRDILSFAIVLTAVLIFSASEDKITFVEACSLIGAYVVYVVCVVVYTKTRPRKKLHRRSSMFNNRESNADRFQAIQDSLLAAGVDSVASSVGTRSNAALSLPTSNAAELGQAAAYVEVDSDGDSNDDDDDDAEELVGIDWDADASTFDKVTFVVEYPFSILRWLSIAGADNKWSKRRRLLSAFVPIGAVTIVFLDFSPNWTGGGPYDGFTLPYYITVGGAAALGLLFFFSSDNRHLPSWNWALVALAFVATVAWLDMLGNECVAVLESLGTITGLTDTPTGHSILGVTVLAWANSIGDFIADTAVTKAGKPEMGVSAVFGSPMLTCCLGIGISTLVAAGGPGGFVTTLLDGELMVSFMFMALSLVSSLCVIVFSGFQLPRWYAFYLLVLYAAYMLLSVLVVTNVVDVGGHKDAQTSRCPGN